MKVILVDLDSTTARKVKRHYYQWEMVGTDEPIQPVIDLVKNYPAPIIVLTGRSEGYDPTEKLIKKFPNLDAEHIKRVGRIETEKWVETHLGDVERIIMKPAGSYDNSAEFKMKKYLELKEEGYEIDFIIDDNEEVCDKFSTMGGLPVIRVVDDGAATTFHARPEKEKIYREAFREDNTNRSDARK